jgi:hypothetical protein
LAFATLALALPALLLQLLTPVVAAPRRRQLLYALLPLVWALLLARHLPLGLAEAGQVVPVTLAPLQLSWAAWLPGWSADPHVIAFCQSTVVLLGLGGSLVLVPRLLPLPPLRLAAFLVGMVLLAGAGRWLVAVV